MESAIWNMEYRTPLLSQDDITSFQNYSEQIQAVYLAEYHRTHEEFGDPGIHRDGETGGGEQLLCGCGSPVRANGVVRVVHYRCLWTGFTSPGDLLTVGDVFIGGLYLGKDDTLIIRPPPGFSVTEASPRAGRVQDGLVWYGIRSFGAGEPRVVLTRDQIPWFPVALILGAAVLAAGIYASRKRFLKTLPAAVTQTVPLMTDPGTAMESKDRILALVRERGGSLYQSEIVDILALPKSTVSEAINRLHGSGRIEKVRKGRENLIRLVGEEWTRRTSGPVSDNLLVSPISSHP